MLNINRIRLPEAVFSSLSDLYLQSKFESENAHNVLSFIPVFIFSPKVLKLFSSAMHLSLPYTLQYMLIPHKSHKLIYWLLFISTEIHIWSTQREN